MNAILQSFENINKAAPEPIYAQIKKTIQKKIRSNEWLAGQKLPSENDLVVALGVSRMTINRALRELTQDGLINRVHGLGSFVAEAPRHASLIELKDIALEVAGNGKRHSSKVLVLDNRVASPEIALLMQVAADTKLFYLSAVHFQDDLPIQMESRFVNPLIVPDFINQDYSQKTSTAYLLSQFQPEQMEHIVRAVIPKKLVRKNLLVEADEPCLQLTRRTWKNDQIITHVTLTYPGSRYDLGARYATTDFQLRS